MERANFDNLSQLENGTPSDKIIVLKSVYKTGKTTVQPVSDGMGWYKGVPRLSDDEKRKKKFWAEPSSKFVLRDGVSFDLNDPAQEVTWAWVQFCPCIAKNEEECQHSKGAEFYIFLENEEAAKSVSRRELKIRAANKILNDPIVNYAMRAEMLGVNMDFARPTVIKEFLLEQADIVPEKVLKVYEGSDVSVKLMLLQAIKKGVISLDNAGFFRYGNVVLGMTERAAIDWMQEDAHRELVKMIEKDTNPDTLQPENEEVTEDNEGDTENQPKTSAKKNSKNK